MDVKIAGSMQNETHNSSQDNSVCSKVACRENQGMRFRVRVGFCAEPNLSQSAASCFNCTPVCTSWQRDSLGTSKEFNMETHCPELSLIEIIITDPHLNFHALAVLAGPIPFKPTER
jgi:hypothetical protein